MIEYRLIFIYIWFASYLAISGIDFIRPIFIGGHIHYMIDAEGWVFTLGLNGIKTWNGQLKGKIHAQGYNFTAATGFTGIKILLDFDSYDENFYLGSALAVSVEYD